MKLSKRFKHHSETGIIKGLITIITAVLMFFLLMNICPPANAVGMEYGVSHEDITKALDNYLVSDKCASNIPYRLYTKRIIDDVRSDSKIEIRIVNRNRGKVLKSDNFQAVLITDGKTIRRFELRGYIGIEVPVAIASRDIKRGERISGFIEYEYIDLTGNSARMPIYEGDEIDDSVTKVNLQSGRVLDISLLERPDLIKRNQKVLVFIESPTISISMMGRALESGKLGEEIRILNEYSGKTIYCTVTGQGEAEIL